MKPDWITSFLCLCNYVASLALLASGFMLLAATGCRRNMLHFTVFFKENVTSALECIQNLLRYIVRISGLHFGNVMRRPQRRRVYLAKS